MESRWVKYEVNLAITKYIQNENYRIVIARIDDCDIHPELQPFKRIDSPNKPFEAIDKIVEYITSKKTKVSPADREVRDWRSGIVDRFSELGKIEAVSLENIKLIFICGIYGIGKSTLAEHVSNKVYNKRLSRFPITKGHDLLRLSLELAARAKIALPENSASAEQLIDTITKSAEELARQDKVLFFDDIESSINEEGYLKDFLKITLESISQIENIPPTLIASSYIPNLNVEFRDLSHIIVLGQIEDKYIQSILEKWLDYSNLKTGSKKLEGLDTIARELQGYPLAARLAAYVIVKYSIGQVIQDLRHFKSIRIDAAKQLIGRSRSQLNELEMNILEVLTLADSGLSQYDLSKILGIDVNDIRNAIDNLFSYSFIFVDLSRLQILPLIKDYFWNRANKTGSWNKLSKEIAEHCENQLYTGNLNKEDFIHYCALAYRLYIITNEVYKADQLKYQFRGEIRGAVTQLYHAKEYELSLKYANMWLKIYPDDNEIKWTKARCLTRLERFEDAGNELNELEKLKYIPYKVDHAWGLLFRQKGNREVAITYFEKGLKNRPEFFPLLRDYGDMLDQIGDTDGALIQLEKAYSIAPRDPFVAPKYAAILEKKGFIDEALSIMKDLKTTFPDEASFHHRLSMLNSAKGNFNEAYLDAKNAVGLDQHLYEAITHLAALELKKENIKETQRLLNKLPVQLPFNQRRIRDTIFAEMLLKEERLDAARDKLKLYKYFEDSYCAGVLARIEYADAEKLLKNNNKIKAREKIQRGKDILHKTLQKFPKNYSLEKLLIQFSKLDDSIC
ncbi:MAG: tetratricopeptide repeat protein [Candidatus Omnitrophota bacterium]|jgi:Flp pilus assembly protein TadD